MVGTIESVQKMETMNRMVHIALHVEAVRGNLAGECLGAQGSAQVG